MASGVVAAVDLGASSGRVMLGRVGPGELALEAVHRFPNQPVTVADGLHWNILELHRNVLLGLRAALAEAPGLRGIGIDSWAVDYGLLRDGAMLGTPYHYRDVRCEAGVATVHARVDHAALYARNGLQLLPFNTLYQLATEGPRLGWADSFLLVPDLLAFWLTGERRAELTNASTTGLVRAGESAWDGGLLARLGYPAGIFPPLAAPGEVVGRLTPEVAEAVGATSALPVTAVGSHDTASAVVGVPMACDDAAYISCGTWGLVGVELPGPVLTEEARLGGFTNEGGVDGRVRFLTNVMGTWLLSETLRTWERQGTPVPLETVLAQAADVETPVPLVDVQDPRFLPPGDMSTRIREWCAEHAVQPPASRAALVRTILESLARAFAEAVDTAERLSGRTLRRVHLVGGGARNRLLCQLTADRCGRTVLAGPVEATALGNVLVQARSHGLVTGELEDLRSLVAATHDLARFEPTPSPPAR